MIRQWLVGSLLVLTAIVSIAVLGWGTALSIVVTVVLSYALFRAEYSTATADITSDRFDLSAGDGLSDTAATATNPLAQIHQSALDVSRSEITQTQSILHDAVERLAENFQELEQKTQDQQELLRKALLESDSGGETFAEFIKETEKLLELFVTKVIETSKDSMALMHGLEDMSDKVGNVLELLSSVKGVSAQINLLSLNASIEAARAGAAGRGFSVVAQEIRNLSDTSRKISEDINEISEGVISTVDSVKGVVTRIASDDMSVALESQKKVSSMIQHAEERNQIMESVLSSSGQISSEISLSVAKVVTALQFEDMCRQLLERVEQTLVYVRDGQDVPEELLEEMGKAMSEFETHINTKRVHSDSMDVGDIELF